MKIVCNLLKIPLYFGILRQEAIAMCNKSVAQAKNNLRRIKSYLRDSNCCEFSKDYCTNYNFFQLSVIKI